MSILLILPKTCVILQDLIYILFTFHIMRHFKRKYCLGNLVKETFIAQKCVWSQTTLISFLCKNMSFLYSQLHADGEKYIFM